MKVLTEMKFSKLATVFIGTVFLSACTETSQSTPVSEQAPAQPVAAKVQPAVASNASGDAKIVIYRTSIGGFAIQPKVFVDGQEAAKCTPNRATTVKVAPGTHTVTAKTLAEKAVTVSVAAGETVYVKCSITVGLVVGGAKLVVVPASKAAAKAAKLKQK